MPECLGIQRAKCSALCFALFSALRLLGAPAQPLPASSTPADLSPLLQVRPGDATPVRSASFAATAGGGVQLRLSRAAPAADRAAEFIDRFGPAFGVANRASVRTQRVPRRDRLGTELVRYQQLHHGVPVTGGEIIVHLRGNTVAGVTSKTLAIDAPKPAVPAITADAARQRARELVAKYYGLAGVQFSRPQLQWLNRGLFEHTRMPTRLAWFVVARRLDLREMIWVDAERGNILLHFNQLPHARQRTVYTAADSSTLPGTLLRSETDPPSGDQDADAAFDFAGDTYDYFHSEHGRDSYNDAGAALISTVHYCPSAEECPYFNAFWNGTQMVYGDGFASADDIVAHELTHAVTESSANLFYYMQSGALNEAYSDIFGETVDLTNGQGTDTPEVRWQVSEDLPGIGAIRHMMQPTLLGQPGKTSDPEFACQTPGSDYGGVHWNSGVPNHAFALMTDGGSYNGFTIAGIGLSKAAKIHYRALTSYLLSGSDFADHYNALKQACQDLIGTDGITANDYLEMLKALDAVELDAPWPCTPAQPAAPALCGIAQTNLDLFFDNFDDFDVTAANWVTETQPGANVWFIGDFFATSGMGHLYGGDPSAKTLSSVIMSHDVLIPAAGARAQFDHAYGFETSSGVFYDGGVIEYSTDSGANWTDARSLIVAGADYSGVISGNAAPNPLHDRNAFVGHSYGYVTTQLDLSTLASLPFRFRFRIGSDSSVSDYGWFIDNFRIYRCVDLNDPPAIHSPASFSVLEDTGETLSGLSISDPDAGTETLELALAADSGRLTLLSAAGLTLVLGDGVDDPAITVRGSLADLNSALSQLQFRSATNDEGSATLTLALDDLGHTGVGGALSATAAVPIDLLPVNDPPAFTAGPAVSAQQNIGAQSLPAWATAITPGPTSEAAQTLAFTVSADPAYLFGTQPQIDPGGTLTFTPAPHLRGTATIQVEVSDDGGTANGGSDTSPAASATITIGSDADLDGNGLPDDWEAAYFAGAAQPSGDTDGDGFSAYDEFVAGTHPALSSSAPIIANAQSDTNGVHISFSTVPGKHYRIETSDISPAGPWSVLTPNVVGTGGVLVMSDPDGATPQKRFYRLVVHP